MVWWQALLAAGTFSLRVEANDPQCFSGRPTKSGLSNKQEILVERTSQFQFSYDEGVKLKCSEVLILTGSDVVSKGNLN